MKRLTLLKTVSSIQLGHLYEHMYTQKIVSFLYDHGVFEFIDYNLDAGTYYSGLISVELTWYSDELPRYLSDIKAMAIEITEDSVNTAWDEVESEKQYYLGYSTKDEVNAALQRLNREPWQNLDEVEFLQLPTVPDNQEPLYVSVDSFIQKKDLKLRLSMARSKETDHLLPLFDRCARATSANIQHQVTSSFGIYFREVKATRLKTKMVYTLLFTAFPEFQVGNEEISTIVQEVVYNLRTKGGFTRLLRAVVAPDDRFLFNVRSDFMSLYKTTGQAIGKKGWEKIATEENLEKLLGSIDVAIDSSQPN